MPPHAKKHHFIPQFLLQHFIGQRGKLVIHQVTSERRFNASVRDVGHRNLGHSIYRHGQEPDHASMEAAMGDIEGRLPLPSGNWSRVVSAPSPRMPVTLWPGCLPCSGSEAAFCGMW